MNRHEEQIINDAPAILELILAEYGETNAIDEVRRLVSVAKAATQRAEAAENVRDLVAEIRSLRQNLSITEHLANSAEQAAATEMVRRQELADQLAAANRQIEQLALDLSRATGAAGGASARADAAERERDDLRRAYALERQRAEAAAWQDAGQCPLCSAPGSRAASDSATGVRVSYCLNCETAALWQPEVQP